MELKQKTCEEILRLALADFDAVNEKCDGSLTDWRAVFEAAFQCVLTLKDTLAIQMFALMCLLALDFTTYSELEDILINHPKSVFLDNSILYQKLNKEEEKDV